MRRLWTAILIVVLAVIATAALIDAFGGRSGEPRLAAATEPAATTTGPLPVCDSDQLALELEVLGATNAVSLRHVKGAPCRAAGFNLRVYVTSDGRRAEIPLGEEGVLDGDFSPNVERSIPFSVCRAGSALTAEAVGGPYHASGPIQPGGENCEGAIRDLSVHLGQEPGVVELRITPLDPVTHTTSFVIDFPRKADLRVSAQAGIGPLLGCSTAVGWEIVVQSDTGSPASSTTAFSVKARASAGRSSSTNVPRDART